MNQPIASYCIEADNAYSHYIYLYSNGYTLRVYEETYFEDWDEESDKSNCTPLFDVQETWGIYDDRSYYRKQLKDAAIQNHRDGKIEKLPKWL